jgi:hypothetical protein
MQNSQFKSIKSIRLQYNQYSKSLSNYPGVHVFPSDELKFVENSLKNKTNLKQIPTNTSVYIGKNSLLPRFKLKEYFIQNKLSKTKLVLNAGTAIINKKSTTKALSKDNFTIHKSYYIPKNDIPKLKSIVGNKVDDHEGVVIMSTDSYVDQMFDVLMLKKTNYTPADYTWISGYYGRQKDVIEFENLYNIASNKNCSIVYDEDVLEQINETGHIVEQDSFENLNAMFQSKDVENLKLGLEILANSNYRESSLKIGMLLTSNWSKISSNRAHWNQNFKSLMAYFEQSDIDFRAGWKKLAQGLIKKNKNNPEILKEIKEYILINLKEETKNFNLGITDITVSFYDRETVPQLS